MDVQADPFVAYNKIMFFCGNEPVWSIEATVQSGLTLFLNIIYETDRQYLHVAVPSERLNMFKLAWKPLQPGKVTWVVER